MSVIDTVDWKRLPKSNFHFVAQSLYDLQWGKEPDLNQCIAALAPYGGPIALARDSQRLVEYHNAREATEIHVYSPSGQKITTCTPCLKAQQSQVVQLAWTHRETLVAVYNNGYVEQFDIDGIRLESSFYLFQGVPGIDVLDISLSLVHVGTNSLCAVSVARIPEETSKPNNSVDKSNAPPKTTRYRYEYSFHLVADLTRPVSTIDHIPCSRGLDSTTTRNSRIRPGTGDESDEETDTSLLFARKDNTSLGIVEMTQPTGLGILDAQLTEDNVPHFFVGSPHTSIIIVRPSIHGGGGASALVRNNLDASRGDKKLRTHQRKSITINDQPMNEFLQSPVKKFAMSPDGCLIALFDESGYVTVMSRDLTELIIQVIANESRDRIPEQVLWCGDNGVAVVYPGDGVIILGAFSDYADRITFSYSESIAVGNYASNLMTRDAVFCVQESDGLRVLTNYTHDFIRRVPESLCAAKLTLGPPAILCRASEEFIDGNADCDKTLGELRQSRDSALKEAVDQCLESAAFAWEIPAQQAFLRAAAYGKHFDTEFQPNNFTTMAKKLRVCNAIRTASIAIPLSVTQLEELSIPVLVARLASRRQYKLALYICDYAGLSRAGVIEHWACSKVRTETGRMSANELCSLIVHKVRRAMQSMPNTHTNQNKKSNNRHHRDSFLTESSANDTIVHSVNESESSPTVGVQLPALLGGRGRVIDASHGNISFANIAATAESVGNRSLATKLLDYETSAAQQVPLLLRMGEGGLALEKACISGDSNLLYLALFHLYAKMADDGESRRGLSDFLHLVMGYPLAARLLYRYAQQCDPKLAQRIRVEWKLFTEIGFEHVRAAYGWQYDSSAALATSKQNDDTDSVQDDILNATFDNDDELSMGDLNKRRGRSDSVLNATSKDSKPFVTNEFARPVFHQAVSSTTRAKRLEDAAHIWTTGAGNTGSTGHKGLSAYAKLAEEHVTLLDRQVQLQSLVADTRKSMDRPARCINTSFANTLGTATKHGHHKFASQLKSEFKESDANICAMKAHALAVEGAWEPFEQLAIHKKPPIPYEAFIDEAKKYNAPVETIGVIATKISDASKRASIYFSISMYAEAAEAAIKCKDTELLQEIARITPAPGVRRKCNEALSQMT